jgi:hypothetical protein
VGIVSERVRHHLERGIIRQHLEVRHHPASWVRHHPASSRVLGLINVII